MGEHRSIENPGSQPIPAGRARQGGLAADEIARRRPSRGVGTCSRRRARYEQSAVSAARRRLCAGRCPALAGAESLAEDRRHYTARVLRRAGIDVATWRRQPMRSCLQADTSTRARLGSHAEQLPTAIAQRAEHLPGAHRLTRSICFVWNSPFAAASARRSCCEQITTIGDCRSPGELRMQLIDFTLFSTRSVF